MAHGYKIVNAIGLPVAYLGPTDVQRVPNSLLVMPPHGHHNHGAGDPIAEHYAKQIAEIKTSFDLVMLCVNQNDMVLHESAKRRDPADFFCPLRRTIVQMAFQRLRAIGVALQIRCHTADCLDGVLASGSIKFTPGLPAWKRDAISAVPMGLLNKVTLQYRKGLQEADPVFYDALLRVSPWRYYAQWLLVWHCLRAV